MEIKNLIAGEDDVVTGWVTFIEGFDVELQYVRKTYLFEIMDKCRVTTYRAHQPTQETDNDKLCNQLARFIRNWRGLDRDVLAKIFPLKDEGEIEGEVPCTRENKLYMLKNAYDFDDFIVKSITDIELIERKRKEEELKNSGALSPED